MLKLGIHSVYNYLYIHSVWILYTKCLYIKCIPHFDKLLYTFFIQNLAGRVLLILYAKCIQKLVEMWCTYFIYILDTSVVHILYNFCIQNVYTVSVWAIFWLYLNFHCRWSYIWFDRTYVWLAFCLPDLRACTLIYEIKTNASRLYILIFLDNPHKKINHVLAG